MRAGGPDGQTPDQLNGGHRDLWFWPIRSRSFSFPAVAAACLAPL